MKKRIVFLILVIGVASVFGLSSISRHAKMEEYKRYSWEQMNDAFPSYYKIIGMKSDTFFESGLDQNYEYRYIGDKSYVVFDEIWKYSTIHPFHKDYSGQIIGINNDSIKVTNENKNLVIVEYDFYWHGTSNIHKLNVVFDTEAMKILGMIGID